MAKVVDTLKPASGEGLENIEYTDQYGNTQTRWKTKRNGAFRTETQVEQLREQTRQRNDVRKQALRNEYPGLDGTSGLDPNRLPAGDKRNNIIKAFMDNPTIKTSVANNPLIEGQEEFEKAVEARARQVLKEFEQADTEGQRQRVIRKYDLDSG